MTARGKAKKLKEQQAKKAKKREAKKAAKAAGGGGRNFSYDALLPKVDADGNPYTKEAIRRMIRRIRQGKPAIPEGKAKRLAKKRVREGGNGHGQEGAATGTCKADKESITCKATAKPNDDTTTTSGANKKWRNKGEKYKASKELRTAKAEAKKKLAAKLEESEGSTGGTPFLRMMLQQEQHSPKTKTKKDKQSTKQSEKKARKAVKKASKDKKERKAAKAKRRAAKGGQEGSNGSSL